MSQYVQYEENHNFLLFSQCFLAYNGKILLFGPHLTLPNDKILDLTKVNVFANYKSNLA